MPESARIRMPKSARIRMPKSARIRSPKYAGIRMPKLTGIRKIPPSACFDRAWSVSSDDFRFRGVSLLPGDPVPILSGGFSHHIPEGLGEFTPVLVACLTGNLENSFVRLLEQPGSGFHSPPAGRRGQSAPLCPYGEPRPRRGAQCRSQTRL